MRGRLGDRDWVDWAWKNMYKLSAILLFMVLPACALVQSFSSWCVPESIYCAWVAGKDYPVRIAVSNIRKGVDHAQAEALIENVWVPLTPKWSGSKIIVERHERHFDVEPYRYLSLQDWIDEQIGFVTIESNFKDKKDLQH